MSSSQAYQSSNAIQFEVRESGIFVLIFDVQTSAHWTIEMGESADSISNGVKTIENHMNTSSDRWMKVVANAPQLSALKSKLSSNLSFKSEFDTKGKTTKLIFYPSTGRVRVLARDSAALPVLKVEPQSLIRVLIVDDSPTIRKLLSRILDKPYGFEVVAEASDVEEAEKILAAQKVDLITLDIHMPGMDGVSYLEKIRYKQHPPVVMISSVNYNDAVKALRCLELGAVDYIEKPQGMGIAEEAEKIRTVLKVAARKKTDRGPLLSRTPISYLSGPNSSKDLIVLGASTGGVEALRHVLASFPENSPPTLIVQHMPPFFSTAFALRLNDLCKINVKEAEDGDIVSQGAAYIAPGGKQMSVRNESGRLVLQIKDDPPVNRHAPSVDYLFRSVVQMKGGWRIVAGLLTGMGRDGADGLLSLKQKGAYTIAESEETAIVYGMPKEAVRLNAAASVLPLGEIAAVIFKEFSKKAKEQT